VGIIAYKIAAHAADIARHRPGAARPRTTNFPAPATASTGTASSIFRSTPKPRAPLHDETLPEDGFKDAHFCSMCGSNFCSMNISAKVETFTAEEAAEAAKWNGAAEAGGDFGRRLKPRQKAARRKQSLNRAIPEDLTVAAIGGQPRTDFSGLAAGGL